jgi:hypothetical protein
MSDEPDDDLIEPGIFLRLRRFAACFFLVLTLVATPAAVAVALGVALAAIGWNVVMRLADRPRPRSVT